MKARIIAYYLPQFHPIKENDEVWGAGFTEWTNVAKARPLFRGHYQPRIPADLGFYDLRLPETREQQAELARGAGIEGFCYWHYWMGNGRMLLQRPFEEVLASGKPDFPFCLAWANHDWKTNTWKNKAGNRMIAEQLYPGDDDHKAHFDYLLPAFHDKRYITVDGNPVFLIYDPYHFKNVEHFMELWRKLAKENGLPGIHFVASCNSTTTIKLNSDGSIRRVQPDLKSSAAVYNDFLSMGFDAVNSYGKSRAEMLHAGKISRSVRYILQKKMPFMPSLKYNYPEVIRHFFAPEDTWENVYPTILPQWDRTPRAGKSEGIYVNATPENFKQHLLHAIEVVKDKKEEHRLLFMKSWNEWGEGNYVEPDEKYGQGFLNVIRQALEK